MVFPSHFRQHLSSLAWTTPHRQLLQFLLQFQVLLLQHFSFCILLSILVMIPITAIVLILVLHLVVRTTLFPSLMYHHIIGGFIRHFPGHVFCDSGVSLVLINDCRWLLSLGATALLTESLHDQHHVVLVLEVAPLSHCRPSLQVGAHFLIPGFPAVFGCV